MKDKDWIELYQYTDTILGIAIKLKTIVNIV